MILTTGMMNIMMMSRMMKITVMSIIVATEVKKVKKQAKVKSHGAAAESAKFSKLFIRLLFAHTHDETHWHVKN